MADAAGPMGGKVCLVTGATGGIGKVTATELARMGANVVVVGRDPQRCEDTARDIRQRTGNPAVEHLVADLSSQAEVRRLAGQFRGRYDRLDVLVNNAGAIFLERREGVDGVEMTFALNHLAYFLLTNLLLDVLKASAPSRIVAVSSDAHRNARLDLDDLQGRTGYKGIRAYGRSKLANVLFVRELARRLEGTGVTANALHPGFVATNIFAGNGGVGWVVRRLAGLFAVAPAQGARTSVYLASAPEVAGVTGRYFVKERPVEPSETATDEEAARRLWQLSEEMTGLAGDRTA